MYNHESIKSQVDSVLSKIDQILKEKRYLTSFDNFTVADILIFSEIIQLEIIGYRFSKYENLWRWMKLMYSNEIIYKGHEKLRQSMILINEMVKDGQNMPENGLSMFE